MLRFLWLRILKAAGGLVLFAFGVYLTIQASIGVSPWDALTLGIAGRAGLSYGNVSVAIALAVLVVVIARHLWKSHKGGGGCCGDCSQCGGCHGKS